MYVQFQDFSFNAAAKTRHFYGKMVYPNRIHQLPEILCIIDGSLELTVDGVTEVANKGDICVITPFRTHSCGAPVSVTAWQLIVSLDFTEEFLSGENLYISGTKAVFTPSKALFDYVVESFPEPHKMQYNIDSDVNKYRTIKSIVYAVFTEYMRTVPKRPIDFNHNALTKLLIYLNEHYTENINLDSVAAQLGYNKTYLSRCVNTIHGVNFRKLVNSLRIDRAKSLLSSTDFKILDIALECGFTSERTLQRAFIEITGTSPSEYRKSKKQSND
ncbi:MAG: helix-turn-helix domain-containing protein [Clostridia bacterium]|nr:helix-turn-helix domain-containing protein [Clostridia bacterium]